jgi:hypothetical protein
VTGGSDTSTLTIKVANTVSRGSYTITVTGTSSASGIVHSTQVALKVPK